ncbi:MAG: hypothetical protein QNJ45_17480, partial [Ardenticatenaceae bacterium]|nr:hypothetical protein [Ardenticatenaceae bacterium]
AVAAGPTRRFMLGDPSIQLFDVLAGDTLTRMAAAEQMAQRNELIVSSEVMDALGGCWKSPKCVKMSWGKRLAWWQV